MSKQLSGKSSGKRGRRKQGAGTVKAKRKDDLRRDELREPIIQGGRSSKAVTLVVERPKSVPKDQWVLPIGYSTSGELITLAEYGSQPKAVVILESLSGKQKKELILERIKRNASYPTRYMVGLGEINKQVALEEVANESSAGKFIIESEQKVINRMKSEVHVKESDHESGVH